MTTKLKLYNRALFLIKEDLLDTVTDDVAPRYKLDAVYDDTIAFVLEQAGWNVATCTVAIEASDDIEPTFGFSAAFEMPEDFVRTVAISGNGSFYPPLEDFAEERGPVPAFHANASTIYLAYVSNDEDYGLNLGAWPETLAEYTAYELASRIAPNLTTMGNESLELLEKGKARALKNALAKDVAGQANKFPPPGRLVRSRFGTLGAYRRE